MFRNEFIGKQLICRSNKDKVWLILYILIFIKRDPRSWNMMFIKASKVSDNENLFQFQLREKREISYSMVCNYEL